MCRPPSSGRVRGRACGLPYPASGWRSRPSVTLHVCVLTGAPRRRRRGRCPPFHAPPPRDVDRLSSGIRREGGEAVIPRPVVRGPMAVALPRSRSPVPSPDRFERATAGYVDRPQAGWGPIIGRERRRVRPMIAPPHSRPRRRSNSDHAGKSTYSGKIDYRFLTSQTGYRFSGPV